MQKIAILGSTGSIGTQALDVISANSEIFSVTALAAYHNDALLAEQIERFKPELAVIIDQSAAKRLKQRYTGSSTKILTGEDGLIEAATLAGTHTVLTSLVGFAGLKPTLAAIQAGKNIALANKETLVAAGEIVMSLAKKHNAQILPVDSEHSAIFQCLHGEKKSQVERLILTASGGPFYGFTTQQLKNVSIKACLSHPNWSMGKKITVDSATLINKGLEVIEAHWLFNIDYDNIDVVVHPQSIIHSMVEFIDGSTMAQMGRPDMRLPIQYALTYPDRLPSTFPRIDFSALSSLTFSAPDKDAFPGIGIAYDVGLRGGSLPCVMNAANEIAVYAFLRDEIRFLDIAEIVQDTVANHTMIEKPSIDALFTVDDWARTYASNKINRNKALKSIT